MKNRPQVRRLTVEQWIAVPNCPLDFFYNPTDIVHATHLHTLRIEHAIVAMATLPDGSECKIDGHKRARVWAQKMADKTPEQVTARVFKVKSIKELKQLYAAFNKGA